MPQLLKAFQVIIWTIFSLSLIAQSNNSELPSSINPSGTSPDNSAILDVQDNEKGVLISRTDTSTINAAVSPATGLLIYQTSDNLFYYHNGTKWLALLPETDNGLWKRNGNNLENDNPYGANSNVNVLGNSFNVNSFGTASSIVDIQSNNRGLLIPRLTETNRNLIPNPDQGLLLYQIDNQTGFYYNDGYPANPDWKLLDNDNTNELELPSGGNQNDVLYTNGSGNVFWGEANNENIYEYLSTNQILSLRNDWISLEEITIPESGNYLILLRINYNNFDCCGSDRDAFFSFELLKNNSSGAILNLISTGDAYPTYENIVDQENQWNGSRQIIEHNITNFNANEILELRTRVTAGIGITTGNNYILSPKISLIKIN